MRVANVAPESPLGLGALRIAIAAVILISPELWQAPRWAVMPATLRFAPEGLGWAVRSLPIDAGTARAAQALLIASCLAAILGIHARLALAGVTLAGLYVFGLMGITFPSLLACRRRPEGLLDL